MTGISKLDDILRGKWKYDQERVKLCPAPLDEKQAEFTTHELTEAEMEMLRASFVIQLASPEGGEMLKTLPLSEAVDLAARWAVEDAEDSLFGIDIHTF